MICPFGTIYVYKANWHLDNPTSADAIVNPVKVYVADKDNEINRVRIVLPDAEDLVNVHTNMYNNYTLNLKNYNSIVWEEDGSLKGFKVAI